MFFSLWIEFFSGLKTYQIVFSWDKIVPLNCWWLQNVWFDWSFYGMFAWCFGFGESCNFSTLYTFQQVMYMNWFIRFHLYMRYNARLNMNNYGKFICFFQSHSMNCMDESIHAKFPSSSWLHGEIVDKRSASRFNRQRHVFDVFWCSKVVKSTVFYGDICHLKRRMSLRKNMRESSKKDYQWW